MPGKALPLSSNVQTEMKTDYSGVDELWAAEKHLKKYNADIVIKISQYFEPSSKMLEFGAGIGTLAQLWKATTGTMPECLEIDTKLCSILAQRGFKCHNSLKSVTKSYDGVYTSNVLEHIEDDIGTLKDICSILKKDSTLAIYVPAFMCLWSGMDSTVGHYRRDGKKELLNKLGQADFKVVDCYFVDSLGFFASLAVKILGYKEGAKLGSGKNLVIYDKYIYPISMIFDKLGARYFFGKNLLVIAKKQK